MKNVFKIKYFRWVNIFFLLSEGSIFDFKVLAFVTLKYCNIVSERDLLQAVLEWVFFFFFLKRFISSRQLYIAKFFFIFQFSSYRSWNPSYRISDLNTICCVFANVGLPDRCTNIHMIYQNIPTLTWYETWLS